MKIVFTQEEMKGIIADLLKEKYKNIIGETQIIKDIKNVGSSYSDVEVIIEEKEAK